LLQHNKNWAKGNMDYVEWEIDPQLWPNRLHAAVRCERKNFSPQTQNYHCVGITYMIFTQVGLI